jgi:hypothetical protein
LGWIFGAFLLVILIGSVHLGWHYAIDGYVGIIGTLILWWACGRLLRWPSVHWLLWGSASGTATSGPAAARTAVLTHAYGSAD